MTERSDDTPLGNVGGHVFYRDLNHTHPVIDRGEGVYLFDTEGRRYLDGSGGSVVVNIGHGVASVCEAMRNQASRVAYVHGTQFTTHALEEYSRRLASKVPLVEPLFYYLSSGSEAVETAIKFARQLQVARGATGRHLIITRWGSYHGATLGGLALSGKPAMRQPYVGMFRDMVHIEPPYCFRCPFHATYPACDLACARQLETELLRQGVDLVAAFVAEPVGGATLGAVVPPEGYWPCIREICDRYGVLLIADEVMTGFGRTGRWFAMEHFGVRPDAFAAAKGATGGYFPLSITGVRGRDVATIRQVLGNFNHGGTFSHHAVGAATAVAVMDYLEQNELVSRAAHLGAYLGRRLREEVGDLAVVGDVRGLGMMWAVEFVADRNTREPCPSRLHFSSQVCRRSREMGAIFYPGHGSVDGVRGDHLMVAPPFVITQEQVDWLVELLGRAIRQVCRDTDVRAAFECAAG